MTSPLRFAGVLAAASILAACGATGSASSPSSVALDTVLNVGASPVPHAEILNFVKDGCAKQAGINVKVTEFTDYIQPNVALQEGKLDANYFQTVPYLEEPSQQAGYKFANAGGVHLEPLGLYSNKIKSINDIPAGAQIAIPNDPSNAGRALQFLAAQNLITLKDTGNTSATPQDIKENPKNLKITEIEAAQLPRTLPDVDAAVINGNYAIQAGLKPATDALALESPTDNPNVNIVVVREGTQEDPRVQKLVECLQSPETKKFIEDKYQGAVIPAQ